MPGSLINRKSDILRAYYNEMDKVNSDYDYIYPITLMENVKDSMTANADNLRTILQRMDNDVVDKLSKKQDAIPAGDLNNIVAYSGKDGQVNQLIRTDVISPIFADTSMYKIPSERAVVQYHNDIIVPAIDAASADLNGKIADLVEKLDATNGNVSSNHNDIVQLQSEVLATKTAVETNHTNITSLTERTDTIETTVNGWSGTALNPSSKDSIYDVAKRLGDLEKVALKPESFGDGYYEKNIGIAFNEGKVTVSNTHSSVKGEDDVISSTNIGSSDGSVKFKLTSMGGLNELDVTAEVTKPMLDKKVDANVAIEAGTFSKVSFDEKGLVTGGNDLTVDDIPNLPTDKITGFDTALIGKADKGDIQVIHEALDQKAEKIAVDAIVMQLDKKLTANAPIEAKTATKVSYDEHGLITGSEDFTVDDIVGGISITDINDLDASLDTKALEADLKALEAVVSGKLNTPTAITPGSGIKVTYDEHGLITGVSDLLASDIPDGIPSSKIVNLDKNLDSKINKLDTPLTNLSGSKVTVNSDGIVTKVEELLTTDLPPIAINNVTGLNSTLDTIREDVNGKLTKPTTKLTTLTGNKVTVDENGLVTKVETEIATITVDDVEGLDSTLDNINNSVDALTNTVDGKLNKPENELTVLSGNFVTVDENGLVTKVETKDVELPSITIADVEELQNTLDGKLNIPAHIDPATGTKVSINEFGIVTSVTNAAMSDITGLEAALSNKVEKLTTPSIVKTGFKVTINDDGLVSGLEEALTEADIPELGINKITGLQDALDSKAAIADMATKNEINELVLAYANAIKSGLEAASVDTSNIDFSTITPLA